MALLNGQNVCDTVAFRISNRLAANGTGAGSIIECCNFALGLISAAASWDWDQLNSAQPNAIAIVNDVAVLTGADPGKEMAFFNASGSRIERSKLSDSWSGSIGYVNVQQGLSTVLSNSYNTFRLSPDTVGATYDPSITFYPTRAYTGSGTVTGLYHLVPPVLVYNTTPTVRWTVKAMDMLLADWTEAYVKKILGMAGWEVTWGDCQKRVGEFMTTYSSQRENTGPESESEGAAQEKQLGRD
jgi:hypothetical protein